MWYRKLMMSIYSSAGTSTEPDFIDNDIFRTIKLWWFSTFFDCINRERLSGDKVLNRFGCLLLKPCASLNVALFNGRCGTELENLHVFVRIGLCRRVDYIMSSIEVFCLCTRLYLDPTLVTFRLHDHCCHVIMYRYHVMKRRNAHLTMITAVLGTNVNGAKQLSD